jgi:hypothetical protein
MPAYFWRIARSLGELERDFTWRAVTELCRSVAGAFTEIELLEAMEGNVFFRVEARAFLGGEEAEEELLEGDEKAIDTGHPVALTPLGDEAVVGGEQGFYALPSHF